ncbi:hypothetical protein FQR65_LT02515 [Abscondita terminalis]|nr:hypothetical protein FQR65_LT02515 [Abscondita terminalis]
MEMSIYLIAPLALDKICRACLSESVNMKPLFGSCLDEMFVNFASIQVHENDGLPNLMCVRCVLLCSRAYAFKQLCEKNDKILKQYISPEFQDQLAKSLIQQEIKEESQEPITDAVITDENPPEFVDVNYIDNGTYKIEVIELFIKFIVTTFLDLG